MVWGKDSAFGLGHMELEFTAGERGREEEQRRADWWSDVSATVNAVLFLSFPRTPGAFRGAQCPPLLIHPPNLPGLSLTTHGSCS